jgi:hypothetical protein
MAPANREDITLPPTWTGRSESPPPGVAIREAQSAATMHASVAGTITALMAAWTFFTGAVPALDPEAGIPLFILHLGACYTSWLALLAGDRADHLIQQAGGSELPVLPAQRVVALSSLIINAAMMVASVMA